jgi:hypothetical protein
MNTLNESAPPAAPDKSKDFSGGHYYGHTQDRGWFPLYEPGKNFTLREARKIVASGGVAVPSTTTVFKLMHKQPLIDWLINQHLDVALRTPVAQFANVDEWKEHVSNVASNSSQGAMDLGTRIHAAYENAVAGRDYEADMEQYISPIMQERQKHGLKMVAQEICVGSLRHGYAGRMDEKCEGLTVNDLKSRKSRKGKVGSYSTDRMQLASYGYAAFGNDFFKSGRGFITGVSTNEPGVVTIHEFAGPELVPSFEAFLGLLQLYRHENNFDPRVKQ